MRIRFLLAAALGSASIACSGKPSEGSAEQAVRSSVSGNGFLTLKAFHKTDGRLLEQNGMRQYEMMFTADVHVDKDAMYAVTQQGSAGMLGPQEGDHIQAQEYKDLSRAGLEGFFYAANGLRSARQGDVLHLTGSAAFEKRESGWVQIALHYRADHDSSTRNIVAQAGASTSTRTLERSGPEWGTAAEVVDTSFDVNLSAKWSAPIAVPAKSSVVIVRSYDVPHDSQLEVSDEDGNRISLAALKVPLAAAVKGIRVRVTGPAEKASIMFFHRK